MSSPLCPSGVHVEETVRAVGGPEALEPNEQQWTNLLLSQIGKDLKGSTELLREILAEMREMRRIQDDNLHQQNQFREKYEATFKPLLPPSREQMIQGQSEMLVRMCDERDSIESQLEAIEKQASILDHQDQSEVAEVVRLQIQGSGLPQRLSFLKEQISQLQRSIEAESLNPANETAAAEPGAPEAQ